MFKHQHKNKQNELILKEKIRSYTSIPLANLSDSERQWTNNRNLLINSMRSENIGDFLNWKIISDTMFFKARKEELNFLQKRDDWHLWEKSLKESTIGHPKKYHLMKSSSGNLIHQGYSLSQFFNNISDIKDVDSILEIGGGYGCMCRLVHKLGFSGSYTILDLPEFSLLTEYYIKSTMEDTSRIKFINEIDGLVNNKPNLLVALWSLSETKISFRNQLLSQIRPDNFLMAYQYKFGEVDNLEYFKKIKRVFSSHSWNDYEIPVFKEGQSRYVLGKS